VVLLNVVPMEEEVLGITEVLTVSRLYYQRVNMVVVAVKAVEEAMDLYPEDHP
jgi:hypothetical protein